ncbi:hypothetical protein [Nocardioides jiangxiensis]|uniref:Rad50/SbcC-type AAA domain-containing protein n=1 Tax=Nocardioides jiangxiensis TaxID=3064524 RepID=A0ABT9AZX5_9ACTN|nr:hypothetical protein [Nocardioides sp. WY-20]MDO7868151.1 hypothetical protein [Nocardioides sp. WY-20]
MNLNVRHLRLRAHTGQGVYGADIPFKPGLMVVRAENSRGKSTAVQSILFALGLERMITTRPTSAVTSAMRDRLIYDADSKAETEVLSSRVIVEIEGASGNAACVTRWVADDTLSPNLVRVHEGPLSELTSDTPFVDYYVGRSGGASSERGFHVWLAEFIGWDMPELPAREGRTSQLYMEQVFPLLFVEQRRGWGGIQAQMPVFSGVTEVRKRAVEFLLSLDVGRQDLTRQRLRAEEAELVASWQVATQAFARSLDGTGMRLDGVPSRLPSAWPTEDRQATVSEASGGEEWVPLDAALAACVAELAALENANVEQVADDSAAENERAAQISGRIIEALDESRRIRAIDLALREDILRDEAEVRTVEHRLAALREDLRQHQDVVTLQKLGSTISEQMSSDCPVCHQHLPSTLLPGDVPTMTPSDSVDYIKKQILLFESMLGDSSSAVEAKRERWISVRSRSDDLALTVQALRDDLLGRSGGPSAATVARVVQLRDREKRLRATAERLAEFQIRLETLAARAVEVRAALRAVPSDDLSDEDRKKLRALQRSFVDQLKAYDFGSFSNEMIVVSEDDYLPRRDNFDLQADISASDSVRVIWAYLLGLLEVGEQFSTNHPGFLVFDEPKQQSAKDFSFAALLRRAAGGTAGRQVVFATSEPLETLRPMLEGLSHTLHVVDGYLLQRVSE